MQNPHHQIILPIRYRGLIRPMSKDEFWTWARTPVLSAIVMEMRLFSNLAGNGVVVGYHCPMCNTTFFGSEIADMDHACSQRSYSDAPVR